MASRLLTAATRLTTHLTYALPWLAVQARIELADAYVTLRDRDAAGHMLEEASGILAVRPDLGLLGEAVARLELELAAMPEARTGGSSPFFLTVSAMSGDSSTYGYARRPPGWTRNPRPLPARRYGSASRIRWSIRPLAISVPRCWYIGPSFRRPNFLAQL